MAHSCTCHPSPAVLDVRDVAPRIRHPRIFQAERTGSVGWRYLEEGPETWRVGISKRAPISAEETVLTVADT